MRWISPERGVSPRPPAEPLASCAVAERDKGRVPGGAARSTDTHRRGGRGATPECQRGRTGSGPAVRHLPASLRCAGLGDAPRLGPGHVPAWSPAPSRGRCAFPARPHPSPVAPGAALPAGERGVRTAAVHVSVPRRADTVPQVLCCACATDVTQRRSRLRGAASPPAPASLCRGRSPHLRRQRASDTRVRAGAEHRRPSTGGWAQPAGHSRRSSRPVPSRGHGPSAARGARGAERDRARRAGAPTSLPRPRPRRLRFRPVAGETRP